jgi:hypothetical protein
VFWGTVLIVLGLGFLIRNIVPASTALLDLWPVLVIGAGLWLLGGAAGRGVGGGLVAGVLVLALGGFWLLENFGKVDDRLFLPVLLIALGVGLLLRNLDPRREA